ncbi:MAG: ribosomal-processing cysteine protease Prp [Ruminococcaceae bacterium]|nr:ribosomal-processing cysteine protease Prp [Oscillospiraceae bacterium]
MTKIHFEKDTLFGIRSFSISGHSGYSDEGSDIVCAYISSASDLIMSILIDEMGIDAETNIDPEIPLVEFAIPHSQRNDKMSENIAYCLSGFANQMKEVSKQFPKFVSITFA